jgi:hypothetical protein
VTRTTAWKGAGAALLLTAVGYQSIVTLDLVSYRSSIAPVAIPQGSDAIQIINIESDGSIRFTGRRDQSAGIDITRKVTKGLQAPTISSLRVGNTLTLRANCFVLANVCSVDFDVKVPANIQVVARSNSSNVRVQGMNAKVDAESFAGDVTIVDSTGAIRAYSSAGSVTLNRVSGSIDAFSSAGSVTGTDLRAGEVVARSTAGRVRLQFIEPPSSVEARSTADDVVVGLPRGKEKYRVTTSDKAGIEVPTDSASTRTIAAESTAGSISVIYNDTFE